MFIKPSHWSVLAPASTGKAVEKQSSPLLAITPCVQLLVGMVCAAMALPFGLRAAALAPIALGFAKGIFDYYAKGDADPADFAWIIAGAAMVAGFAKLAGLA